MRKISVKSEKLFHFFAAEFIQLVRTARRLFICEQLMIHIRKKT